MPRQPGLVREAEAFLELLPPYDREEALRGLEGFTHVWILFVFHAAMREGWKPTVRPPRLGGNERVGVFATRSPFRPNPIGLSVVELAGIERQGRLVLRLRGVDLLDGTPVLDIKPYLPYADAIGEASSVWAPDAPKTLAVAFSPEAAASCASEELRLLIASTVRLDPRPPYRAGSEDARVYGMALAGHDVHWTVRDGEALILRVKPATVTE